MTNRHFCGSLAARVLVCGMLSGIVSSVMAAARPDEGRRQTIPTERDAPISESVYAATLIRGGCTPPILGFHGGAGLANGGDIAAGRAFMVFGDPFAGRASDGRYTVTFGHAAAVSASISRSASCLESATCNDGDPCTFDRCIDGSCVNGAASYGDVVGVGGVCGPDGDVNLLDILAILNAFEGRYPEGCELVNMDMSGESGSCVSNEIIDLSDIIAVLNAFSGDDACCATGG